ncbi:hypothetical protein [Kitasatospora sp. NPDC058190]|uniref:hypothetical protein n=1 Tax=Kitasatospora sp. NPDC058190 TaxID=3346371 RepID=UPI0036D810E6
MTSITKETDTHDDYADDGLPDGWWMCLHHGPGGGPGEQCPDCREHWGLAPYPTSTRLLERQR